MRATRLECGQINGDKFLVYNIHTLALISNELDNRQLEKFSECSSHCSISLFVKLTRFFQASLGIVHSLSRASRKLRKLKPSRD